ncbi:uncharacterized protein DUF4350 [Mucilaginibacter frigoritolerans]|uniref:Uncharacterized protein DUF4350 n=1 Tax=Mucilaginibacter frigoritolerans TaxID=652788 RepID=A0A562U1W3_9SPHI|nr:DUF4350 domain-containing protein [Mucilaginibacter frigoritolerans]TWI99832.1 uncharacterized protein DUF4350 [Mucilaginibacter frigoritolerans]
MKSLKLYLIFGGALLLIYIIVQLNQPKIVDWTETLSSNDKIPFGTYILDKRINDIFPGAKIIRYRQPVYNVIAEDSIKGSTYIIICPGANFTKVDFVQLKKYLNQGNDVFIASDYFGTTFEDSLHVKTETYYKLGWGSVDVKFVNPNLDSTKVYKVKKEAGNGFFSKFDTSRAQAIAKNSFHKVNFIKYPIGKGTLYLSANPKFFGNYSLLKSDGAQYAATALSLLKPTHKIILDQYYTQGNGEADSPMRLFLKNPVLQWAYFITLISLAIFVLFEIKRRQRIIPIIEPLANSTLDFINVVGQVYYEKRNNVNIAQKKVLYFLSHLRDEYNVKTNKLDDEFAERLTTKIGLDPTFANELTNYLLYITAQANITDRELIELNKLIEQFYIKSR